MLKTRFITLFIGLLLTMAVSAQGSGAGDQAKVQAQQMTTALCAGDYKTFVHFNNPALKQQAGGEEDMIKKMEQSATSMKAIGTVLEKITLRDVSPILKSGSDLQCTIPMETIIKTANGKVLMKSTLLGVSPDGGKTWTFLDASKRGKAEMQRLVPNLNPGIVIPPASDPQRVGG